MHTPTRGSRVVRRTIGACLAAALASCVALVALASGQGNAVQQAITITVGGPTTTVTGAEDLRPGPTRVTVRGAGRGPAEALLARLRPGAEVADVVRYVRRVDAPPVDLVSLETATQVEPGAGWTTNVNLKAGHYIAAGLSDGADGLGRYTEFDVAGPPVGGTLPRGDAAVLMYDYGFFIPRAIDGDGVLRIDNIGRNEHFIVGIRLNPGVRPGPVARALVSGAQLSGPPPGEFVSIIGIVSPNTTNRVRLDLKPGVYVLACFYADRASGGHEHTEFGMVRQVRVR